MRILKRVVPKNHIICGLLQTVFKRQNHVFDYFNSNSMCSYEHWPQKPPLCFSVNADPCLVRLICEIGLNILKGNILHQDLHLIHWFTSQSERLDLGSM
jgi:hypothetical protein